MRRQGWADDVGAKRHPPTWAWVAAAALLNCACRPCLAQGEGQGLPVLAVVVGLEGTGHHTFHGENQNLLGIFGVMAQSSPALIHHVRPDQPLAAAFIATVIRTENVDEKGELMLRRDHVASLRGALQKLLDSRPTVRTFLLESCSFPCFARVPYFNPDLEALHEAAKGLADVRMLVMDRSSHDVMTSTVTKRKFGELRQQANTLRMSKMELSHFLGRLPAASLAFSSYEQLVSENMCWGHLAGFWGLDPVLLREVGVGMVHTRGSYQGAAAWGEREAAYITDMFNAPHSAALWPAFIGGVEEMQLCDMQCHYRRVDQEDAPGTTAWEVLDEEEDLRVTDPWAFFRS